MSDSSSLCRDIDLYGHFVPMLVGFVVLPLDIHFLHKYKDDDYDYPISTIIDMFLNMFLTGIVVVSAKYYCKFISSDLSYYDLRDALEFVAFTGASAVADVYFENPVYNIFAAIPVLGAFHLATNYAIDYMLDTEDLGF